MDLFNPESKETDILMKYILKPLFGYGDNKADLFFSSAMEVFLGGCLMLVAILFIFNIFTDTANTANTGRFVAGKGENLTWSILRNVIGIALLIPIGGTAVAQKIFIWLVAQGLLLANVIYEKMEWFNLDTSNMAYVSNIQADLLNSYKVATIAHTCLEAAKKNNGRLDDSGRTINFGLKTKKMIYPKMVNYNYTFGEDFGKFDKVCGRLTISFPLIKKDNDFSKWGKLEEFRKFSLVDVNEISSSLQKEHIKIMNDFVLNKSKEAALLIVNNPQGEELSKKLSEKVVKDIEDYENKVKAVFKQVTKINPVAKKKMTENGIAGAGAWLWALSNTQTTLTNILNDMPKLTSSFSNESNTEKSCKWNTFLSDECRQAKRLVSIDPKIKADVEKALYSFKNVEELISSKATDAKPELVNAAKVNEEETSVMDKIYNVFNLDLTNKLTVNHYDTNQNPLVAQQEFGQNIMIGLETVIGILSVGSAIPIIGSAVGPIAISFLPFLFGLLVSAMAITFYLPMLPFIIWIGNLIGWIVMICQAMLGIPLWLVAFMRNDTDGFVGRTGQGYLLILEGFLRPTLMIFGLFFAFNLMLPVINIVNFFFGFVMDSIYSNTSKMLGLCFFVFTVVIYAVITNKILVILFNLIETIPDKILTWMGSNVNSLMSNSGKDLDNHVSAGTQRTTGAVVGGVGMIATQAPSFKQGFKDAANEWKNKKASSDAQTKAELGITNTTDKNTELDKISKGMEAKGSNNNTSNEAINNNSNSSNVSNVKAEQTKASVNSASSVQTEVGSKTQQTTADVRNTRNKQGTLEDFKI